MTNSKLLVLTALGSFVCSCYNWSPTEIPPRAGPLPGNPSQVQVTRANGALVTVANPSLSADSLIGSTYIRGQGDVRVAIPTTDIKDVKTSTFSGGRTVGLVVGIAVATLVVLYLALRNSDLDFSPDY